MSDSHDEAEIATHAGPHGYISNKDAFAESKGKPVACRGWSQTNSTVLTS
jgi:hypothetical protein